MDANFERAKGHRRAIDRLLMKGEWPVLLDIMGKGEGDQRYLSVAEVKTLFVDRRLPDRINARLVAAQGAPAPGVFRKLAKAAVWLVALAVAAIVAIAEFPNQVGKIIPPLAQLMPPSLPELAPVKSARWLDQNWSTEDRHWFHHASQGTATFPVPYGWFWRWNSRAFICSPAPAAWLIRIISSGWVSSRVRKRSVPTRRPFAASVM